MPLGRDLLWVQEAQEVRAVQQVLADRTRPARRQDRLVLVLRGLPVGLEGRSVPAGLMGQSRPYHLPHLAVPLAPEVLANPEVRRDQSIPADQQARAGLEDLADLGWVRCMRQRRGLL
jgi:hypothetical protein